MNTKKYRIIGSAILAALLLTVSMVGCAGGEPSDSGTPASSQTGTRAEKQTVKIAYLPITHGMPLFVETELQKENPDLSIELVKYGSWPELMDALNTGRVDGASVLIELAMQARAQGIDLKAAALGHRDGNVVVVAPGIENVSALKGKSFAIPHRQSSHYILLNQMLKNNAMTTNDINVVEMPPTEMPSALAQGQISGYCVAEPFGAKAVSLGVGKVLYESSQLWEDSVCCALVFNGNFLKNHPDTAKEMAAQYAQAGNYIAEHKTESDAVAKQYLNVDDTVLGLSMKWISYDDLRISKDAYESLCGYLTEFEILQSPPAYEDFVDASLLEE